VRTQRAFGAPISTTLVGAIAVRAPEEYLVRMIGILDSLGYRLLVPLALLLGLAPFRPEPHLVEKLRMLFEGTLTRPLDIFDLVLHATPIVLLLVKVVADLVRRQAT
ncbi:MAG: hypothetical protein ACOC1U_10080, partial [Spirochaetota bacterium]